MADQQGQISQAAAPGALLRTVAESQANDPTKATAPEAQPNSPIRNLQQNPIEGTIPSSTPRILNVTPAQQPSPDFTGLHALLSSAPVPPPHVAAGLIRAMMTPPSGGVVAPRPVVTAAPSSVPQGGANPSSTPSASGVVSPTTPTPSFAPARTATPSANMSRVNASINPNANFGQPTTSFRPAQVQNQTPTTQTNKSGINYFLPGTIEEASNGIGKFGSQLGDVAEAIGHIPGLRYLNPVADIGTGLGLANSILSRFGLGNWFQPRQAS